MILPINNMYNVIYNPIYINIGLWLTVYFFFLNQTRNDLLRYYFSRICILIYILSLITPTAELRTG